VKIAGKFEKGAERLLPAARHNGAGVVLDRLLRRGNEDLTVVNAAGKSENGAEDLLPAAPHNGAGVVLDKRPRHENEGLTVVNAAGKSERIYVWLGRKRFSTEAGRVCVRMCGQPKEVLFVVNSLGNLFPI
jgi:hypothetical protein